MKTCYNISLKFLESETFSDKNLYGKLEHALYIFICFFRKSWSLWDTVDKYDRVSEAIDENITWCREVAICMPSNHGKDTHTKNI